jgi:hypothetical protein
VYGGLSNIKLKDNNFDLGNGLLLKQTYAHLFSANMVALSPKGEAGYHEGPWRAAKGGFGYDINIEIEVPDNLIINDFSAEEILWLIAALIRLANYPYVSLVAISNISFSDMKKTVLDPKIVPMETKPRIVKIDKNKNVYLDANDLNWIKEKLDTTSKLMKENDRFYTSLYAYDKATLSGETSASLLAMWGGLEQLFAPTSAELRFRVAANIACYLEPFGENRKNKYKEILKLYNERCSAAHTAKNIDIAPLAETFVLMRNILIKIIQEENIPSQEYLEKIMFEELT